MTSEPRADDSSAGDEEQEQFESVEEMWKVKLEHGSEAWYERSINYWKNQEASVQGVLGGFQAISCVDLEASAQFLAKLKSLPEKKGGGCQFTRVIDCGAGIGRVSEGLLVKHFESVDLLEPVEHLMETARERLKGNPKIGKFLNITLQNFEPTSGYDVYWLQWCVLYLTDDDLVSLLQRCAKALLPGGVICIKENVVIKDSKFSFDAEDNSLIRTDQHYHELFARAGLRVVCQMRQPKLPPQLFPVQMYALRE